MDPKPYKQGPSPPISPKNLTPNAQSNLLTPVPLMSLTPKVQPQHSHLTQEFISPPKKLARKRGLQPFSLNTYSEFLDNWQKYFIITRKEGDFSKISPFLYCAQIANMVGKPKSVRKTPSGSLHVEAENIEQARCLMKLEKLGEHAVVVQPNMRLNTSKGVIVCKDFIICSEEEIKNGLVDQGVIEVKRINKRSGGSIQATAALILTFDRPKPPEKIEACYYKLKVRPYIPFPMRCFKCFRFGHTSVRCRSTEQMCVCGLTSHENLPCQDPPTCVNCKEAHNAKSPACPVFQEEKEVQKVKTLENLSYMDARKIVKSKSYVKPQVSYAAAASKNITKHEEFTNWQKTLQPHTHQEGMSPSQSIISGKSEPPRKEAVPPNPSPLTLEVESNIPSSSNAQIVPQLIPTPLPQRTSSEFRPPKNINPLRFPVRSPNKKELRSREKRQNLMPPPQPIRTPLAEDSSREEGGSDTDSGCSNRTVLNEHHTNLEKSTRKKNKTGKSRRNKKPNTGVTTA